MIIELNGEPLELDSGVTLARLLALRQIDPRFVAVERNLAIVPKSQYDETALQAGDRLEIVQFVGGG